MRKWFPTQITWVIILGCLAFVLALSTVGNELAVRIENYINILLSVAVVYRYRKESIKALFDQAPSNIQVLGLGIILAWLANNVRSFYSSLQRDFHIAWLTDSIVVPFFLYLMLLSGLFHLIVPYVKRTHIDRKAWFEIIGIVTFGTVLALTVTFLVDIYPSLGILTHGNSVVSAPFFTSSVE